MVPPCPAARRGADADGLLGGLQQVGDNPSVEQTLTAVRELLDMDVSYVTLHTASEQVLLATAGDAESFGDQGRRPPPRSS